MSTGEVDAKTKEWTGIIGEIVKNVKNYRSFFLFSKISSKFDLLGYFSKLIWRLGVSQ